MKKLLPLLTLILLVTYACKEKKFCEEYNEAYVDVTNNSISKWKLMWPSDTSLVMGEIDAGKTEGFKFNNSGWVKMIFKESNGAGRVEQQVMVEECKRAAVSIP